MTIEEIYRSLESDCADRRFAANNLWAQMRRGEEPQTRENTKRVSELLAEAALLSKAAGVLREHLESRQRLQYRDS